ncbi:MAG: hypothetical protein ABIO63_02300 [Casimicrobiaceae bacterium]
MVVYPAITQHSRNRRSPFAATVLPVLARYVGNLMVTITLAAMVGVALGAVAGFLVVVALW